MKIKNFECHKSIKNLKKNNDWNIRRLVDESFVPANQQTSKLAYYIVDCTVVPRSYATPS